MENQFNPQGQPANQLQHQDNNIAGNEQSKITVSDLGIDHMLVIAKWTKFLAIVATVVISLLALIMVVFSILGIAARTQGAFALIIYFILIIAIYFYPIKKAFSMAAHMKSSALLTNSEELEDGLDDLRSILKFMGILTIITLVPYAIFFIIIIIGGVGFGISSLIH